MRKIDAFFRSVALWRPKTALPFSVQRAVTAIKQQASTSLVPISRAPFLLARSPIDIDRDELRLIRRFHSAAV
jgi:hypothetical protein